MNWFFKHESLTDVVLFFRCEASGGRPVPEVSWWNRTHKVRLGGEAGWEIITVLRSVTPGTGEWNTRMGRGVPRVRLTSWLTDITVVPLSPVKLTATL